MKAPQEYDSPENYLKRAIKNVSYKIYPSKKHLTPPLK
jgi:hypothetical protein